MTDTIWVPNLTGRPGRVYHALRDAIAEAIADCVLQPGDKLPPQRELAYQLGISVGTVGRAYTLAKRQGLVGGEVGRGTYVRDGTASATSNFPFSDLPYTEHNRDLIDLRRNIPARIGQEEGLRTLLGEIARHDRLGELLAYSPNGGDPAHRNAGANWIARTGIAATADRVLVCSGANQAIATALAAVARLHTERRYVITEPLLNVGFKDAAATLDIPLRPVEMDTEGVLPDAVERACCGMEKPAALLIVPTVQNPTTAIMSEERRHALAAVARRYRLPIIEDDVYADLLGGQCPPPIASLYPEGTYYATSLSKSVAPGFRIGYLLCPDDDHTGAIRRCQGILNSFAMDIPMLMGALATLLIRSGQAKNYVAEQAREIEQRQAMAAAALDGFTFRNHPHALHLWLTLPPQWRTHTFAQACLAQGVQIGPADDFAVGQAPVPHCVRLALGAPNDRAELSTALATVADLLRDQPRAETPGI